MKKLLKKGKGKMIINLSGELTIFNIGKIREALLEALEDSPVVELKFGRINALDLSFIQLLHSAHLTAIERKKNLVVHGGELPELVKKFSTRTGFDRTSAFFAEYCNLSVQGNQG